MLIIQKYGGSSMAGPEKIRLVAARVKEACDAGSRVVVVVSAMSGETDRLISLSKSLSESPAERELDVVVSTGEQVSAGLLAIALNDIGIAAETMLSFQMPIVTDSNFTKARIESIAVDRISARLEKGRVIIIPGFQGMTASGDVTTLGRGGSDTTAVAVASALHADLCEICSDVDGVYTADPNILGEAKKIKTLTYDEMLEIAGAGAKVVQMRAVELAAKYHLPLHICSSFEKVEGTMITGNGHSEEMEKILVSAVTHTMNEAKVSIRAVPNHSSSPAAEIFEPLAKAGINVDMIVQNISGDEKTDISFTVEKNDLKKAIAISERSAARIGAGRVEAAGDVSKISIIGVGMRSHAGVAAEMFKSLAAAGIDIHLISTSEIKVSVVVDMKHTANAVKTLHRAFKLIG